MMRILIYPVQEGIRRVLVVPGRRAHLAPIQIVGSSKEEVKEELRQVAAAVRLAETPPRVPAPL